MTLEVGYLVGPGRYWPNLCKPTIDALDQILGRTVPDRPWHPLDGRIVRLGPIENQEIVEYLRERIASGRFRPVIARRELPGSRRNIYAATYGEPPDPPATAALLAALAEAAAA